MAIVNHLHTQAAAGETVFYDIYTPRGKGRRPGQGGHRPLLPGDPGARWPSATPAGALPTWGAMQDSFPHALELSRRGYNAFALLYRPGAQTACEDLAWAITFVSDHAQELRWTWRGTPSGAAPPGGGWRPGWGPMVGGLRRGRPAPGRGGDHAVHRPQRLHGERSPHLRLRGGAGRHRQLADHGAPPPGPVGPGHPHGVPPLPRLKSRLWPGHRHRGGGVAGPGGGLWEANTSPSTPRRDGRLRLEAEGPVSTTRKPCFHRRGPFGVSAFPFGWPGKPL